MTHNSALEPHAVATSAETPAGLDPLLSCLAGTPSEFFRNVVMAYDGNECVTWPFSLVKGYAKMKVRGRSVVVSRHVCELVHGAPPTPEHEAAHSCGKGDKACVTKGHLSWKTRKDNMADCIIHGTILIGEKNPHAKLTRADVRAIRGLKGIASQREISKLFGVSKANIGDIHRGEVWAWLK